MKHIIKQGNRVPRVQGTTSLCINYNQQKTEENKERIYKHIIAQYIYSGFLYNGIPITTNHLSYHLSIPHDNIQKYISESLTSISSIVSKENIESTFRSILALSTQWALEAQGQINQQVQLLKNSQGDSYKPFISSTVNQALKLLLDSNKNVVDLIKAVQAPSRIPMNPNIPSPTEQEKLKENKEPSISTIEAIELIHDMNKETDLLYQAKNNKEYQLQVWKDKELGGQEGILWDGTDLAPEPINTSIQVSKPLSQKGPIQVPEIPKLRHLKRRQKDLNIQDDDSI